MDPPLKGLCDVVPGALAWSTMVRIYRLWKVPALFDVSLIESLEMVFVDDKVCILHTLFTLFNSLVHF
jgi:hypothetical protein